MKTVRVTFLFWITAVCCTWTILGWSLHSKGNRSHRRYMRNSQIRHLGWFGMVPVIFDLLMNVINKYNNYSNVTKQWHQLHFYPCNLKLFKSILTFKSIFPLFLDTIVYFTPNASSNTSQIQLMIFLKNHYQKNHHCNSIVHRSLFSIFQFPMLELIESKEKQ